MFKELMRIVELPGGSIVTILGEDLKVLNVGEQQEMVKALLVLARDLLLALVEDYSEDVLIGSVKEDEVKRMVGFVSVGKSISGEYACRVVFGEESREEVRVRQGLLHWCEVFVLLARKF